MCSGHTSFLLRVFEWTPNKKCISSFINWICIKKAILISSALEKFFSILHIWHSVRKWVYIHGSLDEWTTQAMNMISIRWQSPHAAAHRIASHRFVDEFSILILSLAFAFALQKDRPKGIQPSNCLCMNIVHTVYNVLHIWSYQSYHRRSLARLICTFLLVEIEWSGDASERHTAITRKNE